MKRLFLTLVGISVLAGCQLTQDVKHAQWLAKTGATEVAERELKTLSDEGYLEATRALADLYTKNEDPVKRQQAGTYYRRLMQDDERAAIGYVRWLSAMSYEDERYRPKAYDALWERQTQYGDMIPSLARFYSKHPDHYSTEELRPLMLKLLEDVDTNRLTLARVLNVIEHPEHYPDYVDQVCAQRSEAEMVNLCFQLELKLAKVASDSDQIQLISSAISEGYKAGEIDASVVYRTSMILLKDRFGESQMLQGLELSQSAADDDQNFMLSAKYEFRRKLLMPNEVLFEGLERIEANGNVTAGILLGRIYSEGYRVIDDPVKAEYYLERAAAVPEGEFYLGRLYLSGKLGPEKLQQGVDHLLQAARDGEPRSYAELARAFNGTPGIMLNPTYVYVFGSMARINADIAKSQYLTDMVNEARMSMPDPVAAQKLLDHERSRTQMARIDNNKEI
ncbi:tetratricopeptide repeat protein [Echinimonas agarilytica]|uniref:Sel1 repeat family protein n=1 Tax=Echinimonas agarilytica TaxID=1215918 RepID=A0AA41W9P7_9GAMM|nr:hypothetical protein [Echinimonas agarilytica]MCM2681226.1 hypothetical protein [Echinimonas agarilytica]